MEFCKQHQVLLIPEIDMPGHSAAFERTFKTDMQSEKGTQILKDIIDEVCATFDVPYLHIGTDEVQFTNPDFVPMMVRYIRDKGKKVISYNPGWNYKPGEIDMVQLWSYRGKAQKGIPAIDCRYHYANHFDTYADLVAMFNSRIYNQPEGSDDLAGSIVAFWNDRYIDNTPQLLAENNFYPYMLTLAERAWRGGGNCYFDGKGTLLWEDEPEQLAAFKEFEDRLLWQKNTWLKEVPFPYVRQTQSEWLITDAFPNGGDLNKVFPPEEKEDSVYQYEGKTYKTRKSSATASICAMYGARWFPVSTPTLRRTTPLMPPDGFILQRKERRSWRWSSRTTVVRKATWLPVRVPGITSAVVPGSMERKLCLLFGRIRIPNALTRLR